jgi:hypothetical protein
VPLADHHRRLKDDRDGPCKSHFLEGWVKGKPCFRTSRRPATSIGLDNRLSAGSKAMMAPDPSARARDSC